LAKLDKGKPEEEKKENKNGSGRKSGVSLRLGLGAKEAGTKPWHQ
jgi:hypothetical protein